MSVLLQVTGRPPSLHGRTAVLYGMEQRILFCIETTDSSRVDTIDKHNVFNFAETFVPA